MEIIVIDAKKYCTDVSCRYHSTEVDLEIILWSLCQIEIELVRLRVEHKAWIHMMKVIVGHKLVVSFFHVAEVQWAAAIAKEAIHVTLLLRIEPGIRDMIDLKWKTFIIELVAGFGNLFAGAECFHPIPFV